MTGITRKADLRQMVIALWPCLVALAIWLALRFLFPDVLSRRYFNNIYIDSDELAFTVAFLGYLTGFDRQNRVRLSLFWLWLVLGSLVAGAVADLFFADVMPRFYLILAIFIEFGGAILGFAIRPGNLANLWSHIADPAVSLANRLFRFALAAIPVAFALFIAACLYLSGEWRVALDSHWRDWPLVVALAWGFAGAAFWPKPRQKQDLQMAP